MEWSVSFAVGAPAELEQLEDLLDELMDLHASVSGAPDGSSNGVRFNVEAATWSDALTIGAKAFAKALRAAKLPRGPIVEASAQEWSHFEADMDRPNGLELAGVTEVAEMLDVSRQRVSELARLSHFPPPMYDLAAGPVWAKAAIERFLETWERKPGRPRSAVDVTPSR